MRPARATRFAKDAEQPKLTSCHLRFPLRCGAVELNMTAKECRNPFRGAAKRDVRHRYPGPACELLKSEMSARTDTWRAVREFARIGLGEFNHVRHGAEGHIRARNNTNGQFAQLNDMGKIC